MRPEIERRNPAAWKLRIYVDAIKDVERITDEDWLNNWAFAPHTMGPFVPRSTWVAILREWALAEAARLVEREAA